MWTSRRVMRLGAAMAGLVAAATVYFWPIVGPFPTHTITSDLATQTYPWRQYVTQELFAGHVVELAVSDTRLAAAVAQAPLTDGLAAAMMSPLENGIRLFGLALLDRLGSLFGRQPIYIPGHGRPGDLSIGATPDGPFGEKLMTPKDGTRWHDRVAARSLLSFSWRRPVRRAASVRVPFLLVVPEADTIAPVPAALEVARRAPGAELFRSAGGHYDVYEGGAGFADVLRIEVDFLHRHAEIPAPRAS